MTLTYHYHSSETQLSGRRVLGEIDLHLNAGETHCIIGRSGCGKTTLLNQLAGLGAPHAKTEGWQADGCSGSYDAPVVGYLFQQPRLLPWRTLRQNLALVSDNRVAIDTLLAQVGLFDFADDYPASISLGMARRAALARCLLLQPQLVLMDEPLASLDPQTAAEMRQLIEQLVCHDPSRTMLYVTHDMDEALLLGDRISVMGGSPAQIQHCVTPDQCNRADLENLIK